MSTPQEKTLQEKRAEWGRAYRERKRLEAQKEFAKASKGPVEINIVEADGTEHTYMSD